MLQTWDVATEIKIEMHNQHTQISHVHKSDILASRAQDCSHKPSMLQLEHDRKIENASVLS